MKVSGDFFSLTFPVYGPAHVSFFNLCYPKILNGSFMPFFRDPGLFTYHFFDKFQEESKSRELSKFEFHNLLYSLIFSDDIFMLNIADDFPSK